MFIITTIAIGIILFGLYMLYTDQIKLKNTAFSALSSIEIQLRKRYDLIPPVLKLAKKFMQHEKALLEEITALRTKAYEAANVASSENVAQLFEADARLQSKMGDFKLSMEAYPELKSDQATVEAINSYQDVEDNISAARRFYNAAVIKLNTAVETFPGNLVIGLSGASKMPYYQDADSDKIALAVDVETYLS